ncbi:MAG: cytochrome c biogenesis protein CcdA [Deinococcota bacterium]
MDKLASPPVNSPATQQVAPSRLSARTQLTLHSFAFVLGLSAVFVALGFSAGLVSDFLFDYGHAVRLTAGGFLIFMGLVMLKVIPIDVFQRDLRVHMARKPAGFAGSVLVGVAFGAGWTPCIGPVLSGILVLASTTGEASQAALLLGAYSLGFAVPFLLAAQTLTSWRKLNRYTGIIERIGGILLIVVGVVLLSDWLSYLAPYLASMGSLEGLLGDVRPSFGIAFIAGALSFLSPCVLPILPSFLAYLTGLNADQLTASTSN